VPLIPRLHLVEIHDQAWCPAGVRDAITDLLQLTLTTVHHYAPAGPVLERALRLAGAGTIVDLGSGGGGPWSRVLPDLARNGLTPRVVLTDKYPNLPALQRVAARLGTGAQVEAASVDARAVPPHLAGFRTMFTMFHHFAPADARAVLADAVRGARGVAVFEATRRSPLTLVAMLGFVCVLFVVPFLRPFRWDRLFWTYLVPLVPLAAVWDGLVSCLRTYTPAELRRLAAGLDGWQWEAGEVSRRGWPFPVTYLVGYPRIAPTDKLGA
jgi:hypothetical protein